MFVHVPHSGSAMHGAKLVLVVLAGSVACSNSSNRPPPLPRGNSAVASEPTSTAKPIEFRTSGGTPIAPVVIADDPASAAVQPVAGPQNGPVGTLNGDPHGLTRDVLNRALQGAVASVAACFSPSSDDPMVAISFEADPSGRPSLVRLNGASGDAERCIRNVVQNIRFPSFEGKGVQVDFPVTFHRVARTTQSGNPSGEEQAPTGPPLFMQP
jgi:hypothetical protein